MALMFTPSGLVVDIARTRAGARRIVRPGGELVIGYIDRDSHVGRMYQEEQSENPFYRDAVFVSTDELVEALETAGFSAFEFVQTIYHRPDEIDEPEPIDSGYDDGSFVGIKASR